MWFIYIHILVYVNLVLGGPHTPGKHNQLIDVQYNDVDVQRANVANLLNEVVQYKTAYVELTFAHPLL